ncbi:MAG: glycosyltransferase [Candidatus Shapirobacteria bacterium]|nr:glycosyltransferase [Candidatus Shapirobacteria bacterium]MDD5073638.1 glycosyltransferase [Candidatus Shapirobacteria bacterium]MDD5481401.1 glycosyltransferase [Candidatus Shapirobacteria bacterium]
MVKIALVHDYLKEFGGAERVLRALADIFPQAPIYTAFIDPNSDAAQAFVDRKVIESAWGPLLKKKNLYSPLRFLMPQIWGSLDLSDYDLVITSCSGYFARGFRVGRKTKVVAYCHTPPRFLYGYQTSRDWQKYWPVRLYALIVNHFLRQFDYRSAQQINYWLVNSGNVARRVEKFYRVQSKIIYPPVAVDRLIKASQKAKKEAYFLIVSRLVGAKGLEEAVAAAKNLGFCLKIIGGTAGYETLKKRLEKIGQGRVEFLGRVSDEELASYYAESRGFLALARDEDFGITVVEAQAAGTPVIAFNGGGFRESVKDGKTGILINDTDVDTISQAIERFNKINWDKKILQSWAKNFSEERFKKEIEEFILKINSSKLPISN